MIDTLERIRPPENGKSRTYGTDYEGLAGLHNLANCNEGLAILGVHHQRKMDAEDPFDTISGTLGLTGAADTLLVIGKQGGSTILHVRGRDIEESESALQFNKTTCRWTILGAAAEVHRSSERGRVIGALKAAGQPLRTKEIMVEAEMSNRNATDILLSRMVKDGEIKRVGRGSYGLHNTNDGQIGQKERMSGEKLDNVELYGDLSDLSEVIKAV